MVAPLKPEHSFAATTDITNVERLPVEGPHEGVGLRFVGKAEDGIRLLGMGEVVRIFGERVTGKPLNFVHPCFMEPSIDSNLIGAAFGCCPVLGRGTRDTLSSPIRRSRSAQSSSIRFSNASADEGLIPACCNCRISDRWRRTWTRRRAISDRRKSRFMAQIH